MSSTHYQADDITVLEGLEAVRKRPGMYIGNTGSEGLHSCLREILDNSVDEYMAGHATTMKVVITSQGAAIIADDGRGIPVDIHSKTGTSALETIMTVLHAGGKFNQENYKFSGGLHGVGASVVNALSTLMHVWVRRDNEYYHMSFSRGKRTSDLDKMGEAEFGSTYPEAAAAAVWGDGTGTVVMFKPDAEIFETVEFNTGHIKQGLQQMAYLNKNFRIIASMPVEEEVEYQYPMGIRTYLEDMTKG